jgi:aminopeptidase N
MPYRRVLIWVCSLLPLFLSAQTPNRADSLLGALRPERTAYRVHYYHLKLNPNLAEKELTGEIDIFFEVNHPSKIIQLDLQKGMGITKVLHKKQHLAMRREYHSYFIHFRDSLQTGEHHFLRIAFTGKPPIAKNAPWDGGFVYRTSKSGLPWIGVAVQGLGASAWWPNKDHLSEEPDSMRISITVPHNLIAVSNGVLESRIKGEKNETFTWKVSYPINNYNVTMNIGDYVLLTDTFKGSEFNLPMNYFVLKENKAKALKHFRQLHDILYCFEKFMGPYPFPKDEFKIVETPYLGMEHQGAIAYGNQYQVGYLGFDRSNLGLEFDFILLHETAHEYWGNSVSMRDRADMWIHEAFATYAEAMYIECKYNKEFAKIYVQSWRQDVQNDKAIIGSYHVHKTGSTDMYYKGALMLHTLRNLITDDIKWISLWKAIQKHFKHQIIDSKEFILFINQFLETDYTWLFDHYLKLAAPPKFVYALGFQNNIPTLYYKWEQVYEDFKLPVHVHTGSGTLKIYPSLQWQELVLPDRSVEIDTERSYFLIQQLKQIPR